ncbi:mitochondrial thiamine pyrophosphate carrier 1 [[Candida] railenensis]|uniref:Mitochondrial thiamine pyrophosphate carrier 1 n=1 Tax=[Candida] railenensis TaxID=45579 RepID=A0A9P0QMP0_9ASCO|nr:mitochondrial thiamine pyrophosphate carrier 1 [[Candida] railenensis]
MALYNEEMSLDKITHHNDSLESSHLNPINEIAFGAISGMFGKVVEYPFDTVKVRLQSSSNYSISTVGCIAQTYRNEGIIRGFYQGIRAPLLGACLETAILFASYNATSHFFINHYRLKSDRELPLWTKCVSGGFAGFTASFVLTPIELVKCKLQVQNVKQSGPISTTTSSSSSSSGSPKNIYSTVIRKILANEGVSGLWSGLSSTLIREVFGTAIWFSTYEYMTQVFRERRIAKGGDENAENSDAELMFSGALAGVLFNFSTFPVDTIKSNIQTNDFDKASSSLLKVGKYICQQPGGMRNLYNGLGITLVRAAPANAIIFYVYELLKRNYG